jgi:hypothetical protein
MAYSIWVFYNTMQNLNTWDIMFKTVVSYLCHSPREVMKLNSSDVNKDFNAKAKTKAKTWTFKAKAKDSTVKAKA